MDDVYITYRYAANLADYGQLNWNVGEDPVEGYTSVVLPIVLALFMKNWIRPEAAILAILSILALGFVRYHKTQSSYRSYLLKTGIFYFLPAAIYFLRRWHYYGLFFPNTYYAKLDDSLIVHRAIKDFIKFFLIYLLIPVLGLIFLLGVNYNRILSILKENYKKLFPDRSGITFSAAENYFEFIYIRNDLVIPSPERLT